MDSIFLSFSKTLSLRHLLLWAEHLHNQAEMFKDSPEISPLGRILRKQGSIIHFIWRVGVTSLSFVWLKKSLW